MIKKCTICGIVKRIEDFPFHPNTKDKHGSRCKECCRKYSREYYRINKEQILKRRQNPKSYSIQNEHKTETQEQRTQRLLYLSEYHKLHRAKELKYQRDYRKTHNNVVKGWVSKYHSSPKGKFSEVRGSHKRRARLNNTEATLTLYQWRKILEQQNNKCNLCGKRFTKARPPTLDHIVPLLNGGGLTFENVQALCKSCNSSKNARIDPRFIQSWGHPSLIYATKSKGVSPEVSQST